MHVKQRVNNLSKVRELTPSTLENQFKHFNHFVANDGTKQWTSESVKNGVTFDLSKIEFLEMGALVQLVLIIDSLLRESVDTLLLLPIKGQTLKEKEWMTTAEDALVQ